MEPLAQLIRLLVFVSCILVMSSWLVPQPKENVWITLAKSLEQESFCLNTGAVGDPMLLCLVGIPWDIHEFLGVRRKGPYPSRHLTPWDLSHGWEGWMQSLPHAPTEPQELDLLGSAKPSLCVEFNPFYHWKDVRNPSDSDMRPSEVVSPLNKNLYSTAWCNGTKSLSTASI